MKVFKFGGASLKTAAAINNMVKIVQRYQGEKLIIIVSAMGKSTNALEELVSLALEKKDYAVPHEAFKQYHYNIIDELCPNDSGHLRNEIIPYLDELSHRLAEPDHNNFSKYYDSIVSLGEIISSKIVNYCLIKAGIPSLWTDARSLIKTDTTFQDGKIDWDLTKINITHYVQSQHSSVFLSQGFIGSTEQNETTTLGREGSDFTAAIFASCCNAESVTIWKDVPGILNADPKIISDASLFKELPYNEASEMTFYGAKVIHPKTIKPDLHFRLVTVNRSYK